MLGKDVLDIKGQVNMSTTISKLQTSTDAPIAKGRSGLREDRGIAASGLVGERFDEKENPSTNSMVQRSWLPYDDPCLAYKRDGVPIGEVPTGLSLDIGTTKEWENKEGQFRRTSCISVPSKKTPFFDEY